MMIRSISAGRVLWNEVEECIETKRISPNQSVLVCVNLCPN